MANWSAPSFTWPGDTNEDLVTQRVNVMQPPASNPQSTFSVAMQGTGSGGGGEYPVNGYGYGQSG